MASRRRGLRRFGVGTRGGWSGGVSLELANPRPGTPELLLDVEHRVAAPIGSDLQPIAMFAQELGRVQPVPLLTEPGVALEEALGGEHAETVTALDAREPQWLGGFGHEVLDGGQDTVAGAALVKSVVEMAVGPARVELGLAGSKPSPRAGLAELVRDAFRGVVHVASRVRPRHVVQNDERIGSLGAFECPQLVVDRVPVVVAVDQDGMGVERRENIEA